MASTSKVHLRLERLERRELFHADSLFGFGDAESDYGRVVAVDDADNVYSTGVFQGEVDFDSGVGEAILDSSTDVRPYITKHDSSSNLVWAEMLEGSLSNIDGLDTDSQGNLYLSGTYNNVDPFDLQTGNALSNLPAVSTMSAFVIKLNSDGEIQWVRTMTGSATVVRANAQVGPTDEVVVVGEFFDGTIDLDPSINNADRTTTDTDGMVVKLGADGDFVWAQTLSSVGQQSLYKVDFDASGNVYVLGRLDSEGIFEDASSPINPVSTSNLTVAKLDVDGVYQSSFVIGSDELFGITLGDIAIDSTGAVIVLGSVSGTVDFDPSIDEALETFDGDSQMFVAKYSSAFELQWKATMGSELSEFANDLAIDNSDAIYFTGSFSDVADFAAGPYVNSIASNGANDAFVQKLDTDGDLQWVRTFGGTEDDFANAIAVNSTGTAFITGSYLSSEIVDGSNALTNSGGSDAFLASYEPIIPTSISSARVYYRNSVLARSGVDAAIDRRKSLAKATDTATTLSANNIINAIRGINGIVIDFSGRIGSISADDFVFRMSPAYAFDPEDNHPANWELAPAPLDIRNTYSAAIDRSRVLLKWSNNAIANRWLRIDVLANDLTKLPIPETYYIGHLQGEVNGLVEAGAYQVDIKDINRLERAYGRPATASSVVDINKDGITDARDTTLLSVNFGLQLTNITIPVQGEEPPLLMARQRQLIDAALISLSLSDSDINSPKSRSKLARR
jgi:hypothetical protein